MLIHKGTAIIETNRLILRRFCIEDAKAMFHNWASDNEVTKYLSWPTYTGVETAEMVLKDWIESYQNDTFYQWAIVYKEYGVEPIGSISVVKRNDDTEKAELGYCIGRQWWHRGIMTEALRAVMDFLFDEVGYQCLEACHDPRNPHSGGVMRKCGMKYEGTIRRAGRNNQGICDAVCYALMADER